MIQSARTGNPVAVEFIGVTVTRSGVSILHDVHASVLRGSCTAIVGPNGAGKTTLLQALLGEIRYTGTIRQYAIDTRRPLRVGYVPQSLQFDRGLPLTVLEFMLMGTQRSPLWLGRRRAKRTAAMDLLAAVRAEKLANRRIGALSGGELQRVLLALAVSGHPELLVLDEPASGVDIDGGHVFCELLETLRRTHGFTQLMVSHDLPLISHHATHVICLNRMVFAQGPPADVFTPENLTSLFGIHMGMANTSVIGGGPSCPCPTCKEHPHA